jgi:hypothetical protein
MGARASIGAAKDRSSFNPVESVFGEMDGVKAGGGL